MAPSPGRVGKCSSGSRNNCWLSFPLGRYFSWDVCEREVKSSKRLRNSSRLLFTKSTGEGWERRDRSRDRGCNPDIMPPTQPSSRLSQLKPNSSRTLGRPLPAALLSPNRKAGGTRGQDLRARDSWEQRKGSYSRRGDYFGRCWPGHRQQASQSLLEECITPTGLRTT